MAYKIPDLSVELIKQLDKDYPHRCIKHDQSLEAAHRYAGQRDLIDNLLNHLKRASERPGELPNVLSRLDGSN